MRFRRCTRQGAKTCFDIADPHSQAGQAKHEAALALAAPWKAREVEVSGRNFSNGGTGSKGVPRVKSFGMSAASREIDFLLCSTGTQVGPFRGDRHAPARRPPMVPVGTVCTGEAQLLAVASTTGVVAPCVGRSMCALATRAVVRWLVGRMARVRSM